MTNSVIDKYLNQEEKEEFLRIINPIYNHKEFQKRMTKEYMHHGSITLADHILAVACLTYKNGLKIEKHDKNFDLKLAVNIAMIHDMYSIPWQNNSKSKVKKFSNKHGFRHPLEAVINSINWFSFLYEDDKKSIIIIDSVVHHMFPLGVRVFDKKIDNLELKSNYKIDDKYIDMLVKSTKRGRILNYSISRPKYKEGRLVSKCDKKVSFSQIENIHSLTALLTGKNKSI